MSQTESGGLVISERITSPASAGAERYILALEGIDALRRILPEGGWKSTGPAAVRVS